MPKTLERAWNEPALVTKMIREVTKGESFTVTRPVRRWPARASELLSWLSSHTSRRRPGCEWRYETFFAVTAKGRALAGVIVTLRRAPRGK